MFKGGNLVKVAPHVIPNLGISRTFQNVELYTGLSTLDNLLAARHMFIDYGVGSALFHFGRAKREEIKHRRIVEDIIKLLEIEDIRDHTVGSLPYGLRKRVELEERLCKSRKCFSWMNPWLG